MYTISDFVANTKEDAKQWIELAHRDLEASILLYRHKLYPQALYFFHQAVEKINKGAFIQLKWIKSGKELGHNLKLAPSKVFEIEIDKLIDRAESELNPSERKELEKDYKKFRKIFKKEYLKEMKKMATCRAMLINLNVQKPSTFLRNNLSILEDEYSKILRMKRMMKKLIKIFEVELKKAKRKSSGNFASIKKMYIDLIEKDYKYTSYLRRYAIGVVYRLSLILPEQETFRYPEFQPIKLYTKSHTLIKNFRRMAKHLKNSHEIFTREYW